MKDHAKHLEYMSSKLQENQLFANKVKSEFAQKRWIS
jgi:hypothetical protein